MLLLSIDYTLYFKNFFNFKLKHNINLKF